MIFFSFWHFYSILFFWRSKFYWNSMGNNIFIIFSRNTQQNTTNLAHLLIWCVFTSVLCGVNKEVKENNNNKKPNPILAFLAHVAQRARWAIAISCCRKLFQKYSPLKLLDQLKPNLVWIITRVSSFKIVSDDAVHQPTWPLLLKIEHMVKLLVFG
jgi:hypothetical protein